MNSWIIDGGFGLERLRRVQKPQPVAGPGEVVVRIGAVSLNYRDLMMIRGEYNPRLTLPLVPCSDAAGEVIACGAGVTSVKPGERVVTTVVQGWLSGDVTSNLMRTQTLGGPLEGVLQEYRVLPQDGVLAAPAHLNGVEAACLPCAAVTAWHALVELGSLTAGDTVLVQGSGGVALFALQLAVSKQARVIAISSSEHKQAKLAELGAAETINYVQEPHWHKRVRQLTDDNGVDHVIELGGHDTLNESLRAVRTSGRVSVIGVLSGKASEVDLTRILMNQICVQGVFVGSRQHAERLYQWMQTHALRPHIDRVFAFGDAPEAFRHLESATHMGKVCLSLNDDNAKS